MDQTDIFITTTERKTMDNYSKEILSLEEAAELLNVHRTTLTKYAELGEIPGNRIGRCWRFSRKMLEAWLEGRACKTKGGLNGNTF